MVYPPKLWPVCWWARAGLTYEPVRLFVKPPPRYEPEREEPEEREKRAMVTSFGRLWGEPFAPPLSVLLTWRLAAF